MSIVIPLGVTTPETSYSDMAAGSDPESVEASPAVNEKNFHSHSCGSAQGHGYQGLPYADHTYGAPPPPTPPASPPPPRTVLSHRAPELNGVARGARYHHPAVAVTAGDDASADSDSSSSSEDEDDEEEEERGEGRGPAPAWCRCSWPSHQGGPLLKCQGCRGLDRRRGADGPHRKSDNVSGGDSSITESGDEEVSASGVSYTATQHTPTSITLTVNRLKRSKAKKRKKSTEKARATPKSKKVKAFREGSRKSMRMKNSTLEATVLDENTVEGWETRIRLWTDQYEEAAANQYSADVQMLLQAEGRSAPVAETPAGAPTAVARPGGPDAGARTELSCNNTVLGSQMQLQLGRVTRVQKHRKILRAAKTLEPGTLVIEYRGKVMLKQQFEVNGHFFKKPYPFVLFYKFNKVEMCVDARTFGNDARFIRRSCAPNAEVRHMMTEGMIHLCIYALCQIAKDAEVTIGFDYEFNSCNYKVDCACHKSNQSCPVQRHNLSPCESPPCPPPLATPTGAETRRRKARRKELEGPALPPEGPQGPPALPGGEPLQGPSDAESQMEEVKQEEVEEGEVDENGIVLSGKRPHDGSDRRRRLTTDEEPKQEELEARAGNPPAPLTPSAGLGVSTRRSTYVTEPSLAEAEKPLPPPSSSSLPVEACVAPKLPPPARPSKPRPKSRMSRSRLSSSQRARRQRQAQAQQQAAAAASAAAAALASGSPPEQGMPLDEEVGAPGGPRAELRLVEGGPGAGLLQDTDGQGPVCLGRSHVRCPKTKKYLVTEWLNDRGPGGERVPAQEAPERPLRLTTDPTVLATTLNMLPGLWHGALICTAPKHYVRFGSPFNPERRRPRPLLTDGTYGCYKKRWIKQAEDECCSASLEDDCSSHQSTSSRSTSPPHELATPLKKRLSKVVPETRPAPSGPHPLSPVTPPLPEDPPAPPLLQPSTLLYSPLPSLPTSRCNTPLQFENISSPEASPVHRPESISPEPFLRSDYEVPRSQFLDLALPSCSVSPAPLTLEDSPLPRALVPPGPPCPSSSCSSPASSSDAGAARQRPAREPHSTFRTEFNLIYQCSPLNANLGPAPGGEPVPAPGSPQYGEPLCGGSTPPHAGNPPQKKKVSLLEYRKRKQGGSRDAETASSVPLPPLPLAPTTSRPGPAHYGQEPLPPHLPPVEEQIPPVRTQDCSSHWTVPTSVELLREGQLKGSITMERLRRRELKETDAERYDVQTGALSSPMRSPHPYSPSVYQQACDSQWAADSPSFLQSSCPPTSRLPPSSCCSQDHSPSSSCSSSSCCSSSCSSSDSQPAGGAVLHLRGPPHTAADSRLSQQPGAAHYPPRGARLPQFTQHPPLQGPGLRTQSGSF